MTSVWRLLITALTLTLFSHLAAGALVKDINPGPGTASQASSPP
jgi:hypothetical protein